VLAVTGSTWTQVVILLSICVPVLVTLVLTWVFLRGARDDPDAKRMRRAQEEFRGRRRV
jgi:hypothetical protein